MLPTNKRVLLLFTIAFTFIGNALCAQTLTQTVRGRIIDQESLTALPGATVVVLESKNQLGTTTDVDGNFRIDNVPVGRIALAITFIGYEDRIIPNILVTSGKETVLEVVLKESLLMLEAVEIKADKSEIANEMALTSARGCRSACTNRMAAPQTKSELAMLKLGQRQRSFACHKIQSRTA